MTNLALRKLARLILKHTDTASADLEKFLSEIYADPQFASEGKFSEGVKKSADFFSEAFERIYPVGASQSILAEAEKVPGANQVLPCVAMTLDSLQVDTRVEGKVQVLGRFHITDDDGPAELLKLHRVAGASVDLRQATDSVIMIDGRFFKVGEEMKFEDNPETRKRNAALAKLTDEDKAALGLKDK